MQPATVASLALALLAPLAAPQSAGAGDERAATVQDVEVLRRLLVESVTAAARPPQDAALQRWRAFTVPEVEVTGVPLVTYDALTSSFGHAEPVAHSRGFHVPGQGVLLTLDVRVPVRQAPARSADDPPADEEQGLDEWERVQRELERGRTAPAEARREAAQGEYAKALDVYRDAGLVQRLRAASASEWELDPEALARVERAVLETLERHGARVRGLRGDEGLTVALYVDGASRAVDPTQLQAADAGLGYWNLAIAGNAARQVPARHVVVHVRRADLDGLRPGELAGRARVDSY